MDRKHFLSSLVLLGAPVPALPHLIMEDDGKPPRKPPYLKQGDVIGITCPAGFITLEEIQPAMKLMESWGFTMRVGDTVGKRDFTFGGTDEERTKDLQQQLD